MNNRSGKVTRSPCARAGNAPACFFNISCGRSSLPNTDALFSVLSDASDPTGLIHLVHEHEAGRAAVDDWRVSLHEAGHVVVGRSLGMEVGGVTIVEGPDYGGLTWGPQGNAARLSSADENLIFVRKSSR